MCVPGFLLRPAASHSTALYATRKSEEADILSIAENTMVLPANSYGFMDGGIDLVYTNYYSLQPQTEIQELIARREEDYLPVGAAVPVKIGHKKIPYVIAAPTMMMPGPVAPYHAFFAMSAILKTAYNNHTDVTIVFCPGLATGIGNVPPESVAKEMAHAYRKWKNSIKTG